MILYLGSLAFNTLVEGGGGTPSWGTEMGQGEGYKFEFEDKDSFITSLVYNSIPDTENVYCPLGRGGNQAQDYEFVVASLYKKIYVNGIFVNDAKFLLLVVKKLVGQNHVGRRSLKYNPRMKYNEEELCQDCYTKMATVLGLTPQSAWFINEITTKNQDELHFTAYVLDQNTKTYASNDAKKADMASKLPANRVKDDGSGIQKIYYGAPGTGKSWKIKNEIIPIGCEPYRITFYSDYYYSDFVGGLRPKSVDGSIRYEFEPGPFAKALKDAFLGKNTYVIIEEINRGNAAAVFGDLFQLLDRKAGKSEYSITNHDLYQYLVDSGVEGLEEDKVYLPANLNILCTMNTADQNVFVLDTAFKRRFKMEYVPINFKAYFVDNIEADGIKDECKGYLENVDVFNGADYEADLKTIMGDELHAAVKKVIAEPKRDWPSFASMVNAKIDQINKEEQKISEDKKLGPFFVDTDELKSRQAFADKVLYYLKQDVFKYEDNILDDSYEKLYDDFVNKNVDIFRIFQPAR